MNYLAHLFLAQTNVESRVGNLLGGITFLSAMFIFGAGVLLGAVTTGFTYLTQFFFSQNKDKLGTTFQIISIILGISSLVTFGLGTWFAYQGFGSAFGT